MAIHFETFFSMDPSKGVSVLSSIRLLLRGSMHLPVCLDSIDSSNFSRASQGIDETVFRSPDYPSQIVDPEGN
jgi:hypothetical protein